MRDPARFWQESRMSALEIVSQGGEVCQGCIVRAAEMDA